MLIPAFLLGLTMLTPLPGYADDSIPTAVPAIAEPEDIAVVYYFDKKGGIAPLEMHRAQYLNRQRLFRGAQGMLVVPDITSPVQFTEGQIPEFVINVLLPMQLPTTFELFPLTVNKKDNQRAVVLTDEGFWTDRGSRAFHLRARRHGVNSFKLICTNPLPPGEYAFKYGLSAYQSKDLYCFTVLPKTPAP